MDRLEDIYNLLKINNPNVNDSRIHAGFHLNCLAAGGLVVTFDVTNEWHITGIQLPQTFKEELWEDDTVGPVQYLLLDWETYYIIQADGRTIWSNWFPVKKMGDPSKCFRPPIIARDSLVITIANYDANAHYYDCIIEGFERKDTQENIIGDIARTEKLGRDIKSRYEIKTLNDELRL